MTNMYFSVPCSPTSSCHYFIFNPLSIKLSPSSSSSLTPKSNLKMKELIRRLTKLGDSSPRYKLLSSETEQQKAAPEGHVPVYVGEEMERFEVRAELLGHPIFAKLLQRSAQEYGYEQRGVLRIPCSISLFERVLDYLMEFGDQQELPDEVENEILRFS